MTLKLVSLLGPNIDEACVDLAQALVPYGFAVRFDPGAAESERMDMVTSGAADVVWLCGKLAVDLMDAGNMDAVPAAAPEFTSGSGPIYSSVVVAARPLGGLDDLTGPSVVWAANEPASWSGHDALLAEFERRRLPAPAEFRWSGSHVESIRMVESGDADCAAIDRSVWDWAAVDSVFVVDETQSWPSPPLCVSPSAIDRDPDLPGAIVAAGPAIRNVERLIAVSSDHLDPIAAASRRSLRQA